MPTDKCAQWRWFRYPRHIRGGGSKLGRLVVCLPILVGTPACAVDEDDMLYYVGQVSGILNEKNGDF